VYPNEDQERCPRCGTYIVNADGKMAMLLDNGSYECASCRFCWHHKVDRKGRKQLVYWSPINMDYFKVPKGLLSVFWEEEVP
jgi:hypothetical protein